MELWFWAAALVLALIIEFTTPEMVSIWFAAGALVALILAAIGLPTWVQVLVFSAVSLTLLLSLRKLLVRYLEVKDVKTNADGMVGKGYVLSSEVSPEQPGSLKAGDVEWVAITEGDAVLPAKSKAIVTEIRGNKLVVKGEQNHD